MIDLVDNGAGPGHDGNNRDRTGDTEILVFGYGSLMWSPGFEPARILPARVFGWHRRFNMVSTTSWGSPEQPGLCAALHRGGTSWGRALAVSRDRAEETLGYLDAREAAYLKRRVSIVARIDGHLVRTAALTYVADPASPRIAPDLGVDDLCRLARQGVGSKGTSFDYVHNAKRALDDDGHTSTDVHRFFAMIVG